MFTKLWSVQLSDLQRGLIIAIIMAVLTTIYEGLKAGKIDWQTVLTVAIGSGVSYLGKNFFTGSNGNILSNK